jgi:hypothetical protein
MEMLTLTAHEISPFNGLEGKNIRVPAGAFVSGKSIIWFIPKGSDLSQLAAA